MFAGTTGPLFICSLPNVKGERPGERPIITRDATRIREFVAKWDIAGRATYFCTATLKPAENRIARRAASSERCEENIAEIVGLHSDIDFKNVAIPPAEILRVLKNLRCLPTIIVNSGHGLHGYWLFREPIGTELGTDITNRIIAARIKLAAILAGDAVQDIAALDAAAGIPQQQGRRFHRGDGRAPGRRSPLRAGRIGNTARRATAGV